MTIRSAARSSRPRDDAFRIRIDGLADEASRQIEEALNEGLPSRYPGRVEVLSGDDGESATVVAAPDVVISAEPSELAGPPSPMRTFDASALLKALEQLARRDGPHPVPPLGADGVAAFCRRLFDAAAVVVDDEQEFRADARKGVLDLAFAAELASAIRRFAVEGLPLSERDPRLVIPTAARALAVATSVRHG
ncbi:hypothetical protein [Agrococcus sediminis]|uniref:hypothetical protein n=1 Tax=Agrococcus sediminis TaxID=2599924 RepID=UPI0034159C5C